MSGRSTQGLWKSPENFSPLPSLAFGFVLPLPSLVYLQADDEATVGLTGRRLVTGIIHQHMLGTYSGAFRLLFCSYLFCTNKKNESGLLFLLTPSIPPILNLAFLPFSI